MNKVVDHMRSITTITLLFKLIKKRSASNTSDKIIPLSRHEIQRNGKKFNLILKYYDIFMKFL